MVNNIKRQKKKANTPKPASSPPLNAPAQALSGDETKRRMALVNADREIVRKIMTEPGPRWEPQSPAEGRKRGQLFSVEREGGGGDAVRLQLHALAYTLGNSLRPLATPEPIKDWSLTSLKDKLIKIGAKVVSHGRYVVFQMAEVAIARQMFQEILRLIAELRPQPPPAPA